MPRFMQETTQEEKIGNKGKGFGLVENGSNIDEEPMEDHALKGTAITRIDIKEKEVIQRNQSSQPSLDDSVSGSKLVGGVSNEADSLRDMKLKKKNKKPRLDSGTGDKPEAVDIEESSRHNRLLEKRLKSLKKAERLASRAKDVSNAEDVPVPDVPVEVHDLVPLPQPEPVPELPSLPTSASLPQWLASPIRVAPSATAQFESLGISKDVAKVLHQKGYNEAFAVQAAVLPLLLPGSAHASSDILVSAATGSGKTLSYVLPMVENISRSSSTSLQGLIVMPTRELVTQARQVSEICASAFARGEGYLHRVKIGTAVGNETVETERDNLMTDYALVDTDYAERYTKQLRAEYNAVGTDSDPENRVLSQQLARSTLRGDVVNQCPKVDILICTPGRLVEHLKFTPGFSLSSLKWLVVDEADKLLDQSFQHWLPTIMAELHQAKRPVKKIILSATMTRDVGQLNQLKLVRPKLVVLEGSSRENDISSPGSARHVIPSLLVESSIKVDDDGIKPLYLMELLRREKIILETRDSSSDEDDDHDDDDASSSSDTESSDSEDDDSSSTSATHSSTKSSVQKSQSIASSNSHRGVLIFTKSNETAVRLGRLVALLSPSLASSIGTLTSTTPRASRERTISSFASGKIFILVASDLVSRGLDLPDLAHVINYDVPNSVESYVHRIGRTARAGKKGQAWTLYTATEGRWFVNEIGRSEIIERPNGLKMGRLNIKEEALAKQRPEYEAALEQLGKEASSSAFLKA